jgi:hypothetical protein
MELNKTELDNMNKLDNMVNDLDKCGDKYCGNIITSRQIKKEEIKFLKNVTKKCRSNIIPKNKKEYDTDRQKYDKCFTKYKKHSNYYKKLTQRKKCEDKKCSIYQKKIQKMLLSKKNLQKKEIKISNNFKKKALEKNNLKKQYKLHNFNTKGGSKIYEDGRIIKTNETFKGKPFFRKIFYYGSKDTNSEKYIMFTKAANAEITISKILIQNPFPNIVTFYNINKDFVEMEELDITTNLNREKLIESMKKVKDFLQSLGIMYVDWKEDNIGISEDGTYKLFDFDASGIVDLKTNNWILEPLHFWSYNKAIENGCTTPKQIDDFSFNYNIIRIKDKTL